MPYTMGDFRRDYLAELSPDAIKELKACLDKPERDKTPKRSGSAKPRTADRKRRKWTARMAP
jgi:hypothetical protein